MGDLVYKYTPVWQPGHTKKFTHMWGGPYVVLGQKFPNLLIKMQGQESAKSEWVHVNRLKQGYLRGEGGSTARVVVSDPGGRQVPREGEMWRRRRQRG